MNLKSIEMANIQKQMKDVSADLERNAFDLSERHLFSAKVGELLPIYNKQVVPGDYFEIDPVSFLRTQRVNTASYARMRQHIDFFFVPYWQLWHSFPEFKYQRKDPVSALGGFSAVNTCPFMHLGDLYAQVLDINVDNPAATAVQPVGASFSTRTNEFGYLVAPLNVKLCDLLGYGNLREQIMRYGATDNPKCVVPTDIPSVYSQDVTIWPWLAYQKIWNDFYRNPYYDVAVTPSDFNVDDCYSVPDINHVRGGSSSASDRYLRNPALDGIFKMRYRQWKQDYFTGLFPERQFGDVSQVLGTSPVALSPTQNGIMDLQSGSDGIVLKNGAPQFMISGVTALDIRRAELLQIWKEKTMRAGYRTESQQRAHFGVGSDYIPDNHVRHLGGYSEVVNISEVVSTSLNNTGISGSDGLGELGGKGTSLGSGDKIRFKVKDDGIIMCIFSVLPESEYNSYGLAPDHTRLAPFDYFTPAFQNLGFSAVTRSQLDMVNLGASYRATDILGYAPPYYDMKMGIDRVHGEFTTQQDLITQQGNVWPTFTAHGGSLQAFDSARRDATKLVGTLPFFYVNPNVVDSVFAFNADSFDDSDQFFVNMFLNIKAVRPMSVLGLPNF